ncbi:MAG TPA: DUF420 domain-containing protein [Saprospiraceae bacterium]|nr:DUF420 domain-containing protein [Saprospiraceae bacterium]
MRNSQKHREKILNRLAIGVSVVVFVTVVMMRRIKIETSIDFSILPAVNATINTVTTLLLLLGLWQIKQKNISSHRRVMSLAIILSSLFLVSYVVYHLTTPETKFGGDGLVRILYLILLGTHIILAGAILPFILFTYIRAITGQYERHKKLARRVFPLWLYVAITGPVIYFMLRPYY